MSAFKDQSWSTRFARMGDEAEGHFEQFAEMELGAKVVKFGLNRPGIQLHSVPARIRHTPDYLMANRFVEVQGLGRDQKYKLKIEKHGALHWWNDVRTATFEGVFMYVWDSFKERETFFPFSALDTLVNASKVQLGSFHEGNPYFEYDADDVFALA